ncbi:hypothetical protein TNCV_3279821 [Trichonephila clavipes]|nr:hypothetical protein TNCV_3279821 [Trichonephila clavipes]
MKVLLDKYNNIPSFLPVGIPCFRMATGYDYLRKHLHRESESLLCSSRDFRQTTLPYLCPNQTSGYSNLEVSGFVALKFGLDEGGFFILDYTRQKLQGSLQNNNQDVRWSRN